MRLSARVESSHAKGSSRGKYGKKAMSVYHLQPIYMNHRSWRSSDGKDGVWACAPAAKDARALVADKTRVEMRDGAASLSPWQDETVTSCVLEPSMTHLHAGVAVMADGSLVGD